MNNNDNKITFIQRKKNEPWIEKVKSYKEVFDKWIRAKCYKEEKLIYRIIYDKIYRPELFKIIMNSDKSIKNINMIRNIFQLNEDNFVFEPLRDSSTFKFTDDELYTENNFVNRIDSYFRKQFISSCFFIPLGLLSLYFRFFFKSQVKFYVNLCISTTIVFINLSASKNKKDIYKGEITRMIMEGNKNEFENYKKFYYDD